MKLNILKFFCLLFLLFFIFNEYSIAGEWKIKHEIKSPTNNTNGLTWDGKNLWLSNGLLNNIYKLDPKTGSILKEFHINIDTEAEDLAWDGENLWICDKSSYLNPKKIHKIDTTNGQILSTFEIFTPDVSTQNLNGLTFDGQYLIVGDAHGHFYRIDPYSGLKIDSLFTLESFGEGTDGIAWDGNYLWVVHNNGLIFKLNYLNGNITDQFDAPSGVGTGPEGLTWDGSNIWYADNTEDKIYQLELFDQKVIGNFFSNQYDLILCNSIYNKRKLKYDLTSFNSIDSLKLVFGYFNFDWIIDEYPFKTTKENVSFDVQIEQNSIISKYNITDNTTKLIKIDITSSYKNQDTIFVQFSKLSGDDDIVFVQPILLVSGSRTTTNLIQSNTYKIYPHSIELNQNYPNPFNPSTKINFSVVRPGHIRLEIFNSMGQKVKTLTDGLKTAGSYEFLWDGKDNNNNIVSSGTYYYQIKSNEEIVTKKMLLIR